MARDHTPEEVAESETSNHQKQQRNHGLPHASLCPPAYGSAAQLTPLLSGQYLCQINILQKSAEPSLTAECKNATRRLYLRLLRLNLRWRSREIALTLTLNPKPKPKMIPAMNTSNSSISGSIALPARLLSGQHLSEMSHKQCAKCHTSNILENRPPPRDSLPLIKPTEYLHAAA